MDYLRFDRSDNADGTVTLEAMASTGADEAPRAQAEADRVLAWARREFPDGPGPLDEGHPWDVELATRLDGRWHELTLTIAATPAFADAFAAAFGDADD